MIPSSERLTAFLSSCKRGGAACDAPVLGPWEAELSSLLEGSGAAVDADGEAARFAAVLFHEPTGLLVGGEAWRRKLVLAKHGATIAGPSKARLLVFAGDPFELFALGPEGHVWAQSRGRPTPVTEVAHSLDDWLLHYALRAWGETRPLRAIGPAARTAAWPEPSVSAQPGPACSWEQAGWVAVKRGELVVASFSDAEALIAWQPWAREGFVLEPALPPDVRPITEAPASERSEVEGWPHPRGSGVHASIAQSGGGVEQVLSIEGRVVETLGIGPKGCSVTSYLRLGHELDPYLSLATTDGLRRHEARLDPRYRRAPSKLAELARLHRVELQPAAQAIESHFAGLYLPATGFLVGVAALLDPLAETAPWPDRPPRAKGSPLTPVAEAPEQSFWVDATGAVHAFSHEAGRFRKVANDFDAFLLRVTG